MGRLTGLMQHSQAGQLLLMPAVSGALGSTPCGNVPGDSGLSGAEGRRATLATNTDSATLVLVQH